MRKDLGKGEQTIEKSVNMRSPDPFQGSKWLSQCWWLCHSPGTTEKPESPHRHNQGLN